MLQVPLPVFPLKGSSQLTPPFASKVYIHMNRPTRTRQRPAGSSSNASFVANSLACLRISALVSMIASPGQPKWPLGLPL
jgi:hypothetical protein